MMQIITEAQLELFPELIPPDRYEYRYRKGWLYPHWIFLNGAPLMTMKTKREAQDYATFRNRLLPRNL